VRVAPSARETPTIADELAKRLNPFAGYKTPTAQGTRTEGTTP
jgi:hypothetical protein